MKSRKFYVDARDFYAPALALAIVLLALLLMAPSTLDAGRAADTVVGEPVGTASRQ